MVKQNALATSKILLIASHTTLVLGLYQYFVSSLVGFKTIQSVGMATAMKDAVSRFWAVEHIFSMVLAIILITIGHIKYKKTGKTNPVFTFYLIALLLILSATPWPFRAGIGRPWFPGVG